MPIMPDMTADKAARFDLEIPQVEELLQNRAFLRSHLREELEQQSPGSAALTALTALSIAGFMASPQSDPMSKFKRLDTVTSSSKQLTISVHIYISISYPSNMIKPYQNMKEVQDLSRWWAVCRNLPHLISSFSDGPVESFEPSPRRSRQQLRGCVERHLLWGMGLVATRDGQCGCFSPAILWNQHTFRKTMAGLYFARVSKTARRT